MCVSLLSKWDFCESCCVVAFFEKMKLFCAELLLSCQNSLSRPPPPLLLDLLKVEPSSSWLVSRKKRYSFLFAPAQRTFTKWVPGMLQPARRIIGILSFSFSVAWFSLYFSPSQVSSAELEKEGERERWGDQNITGCTALYTVSVYVSNM